MRIYQAASLAVGSKIRLDDKAGHHLARVLRAKIGDSLVVFNGLGGEYSAVISHIDKKGVDLDLLAVTEREVESPIHIELAQGIAKGEKMDFIVQKAVELGVNTITPLVTERCNVRLTPEREEKRNQHWQAVAVSACEQSGRNRLPQITPALSLSTWLTSVKADYRFVLSPHVDCRLPKENLKAQAKIALLIGPEGGLSQTEVDTAIQYGFIPLQLGPRILRTETATLAALTVLQSHYGDLR